MSAKEIDEMLNEFKRMLNRDFECRFAVEISHKGNVIINAPFQFRSRADEFADMIEGLEKFSNLKLDIKIKEAA